MGEVHKLEFKDEAEKRKEARGYSALIFFHKIVHCTIHAFSLP